MCKKKNKNIISRTLVFHFGSLGDFILSWSSLGLLVSSLPYNELYLIGNSTWGKLILSPQRLFDRETFRMLNTLFSTKSEPKVNKWLVQFVRVVIFASCPDKALLAHIRLSGIKEILIVPTRPKLDQRLHISDLQVSTLRSYGLFGPALAPFLRLKFASQIEGAPVISPGSGGVAKRLEPTLVACAAKILNEFFPSLIILLGPAESYKHNLVWRRSLDEALSSISHLCIDNISFSDLVQILITTPIYLGSDSGVSHLAAAFGVPTLAIFQATDPIIWAPRGEKVRVCGIMEWEFTLRLFLSEIKKYNYF